MIITGANGVVGADLVKFFSKTKKVFAVYRTPNQISKSLRNKNIKWIKQDLSKNILKNIKSDIIIHCAVTHPFSKNKKYSDFLNSNIIGLKNILEYAKKNKVQKIIHLSSVTLYGDVKTNILKETNPFLNPQLLGATKILMEKMIEQQNINFLNIRLPGVVGYQINDPSRPWLCKILNRLKNNKSVEIFNYNKKFNNIVDTYEIYKFIHFLLSKKTLKSGSVNFSATAPLQLNEIIMYMKRKLNSKSKILYNNKKTTHFTISSNKVLNKYFYKVSSTKVILQRYIDNFIRN